MHKKFVWTIEYSVDIPLIDEQHQAFFRITNDILDMVDGGDFSKDHLMTHVNELANYALYHLSTEEEYFKKGYQDSPVHIASHDEYREVVKGYVARIEKEVDSLPEIAGEAAAYSSDWLSQHIMTMDKKYTEFFHQIGL